MSARLPCPRCTELATAAAGRPASEWPVVVEALRARCNAGSLSPRAPITEVEWPPFEDVAATAPEGATLFYDFDCNDCARVLRFGLVDSTICLMLRESN